MSLRCSGGRSVNVPGVTMLGVASGSVLVHTCGEACEEDDEGCEKEEDHGCENGPHADRVVSVRSAAVLIDFVLDDTKGYKVARHRYNCDDEGDRRDHRCH